MTRAQNQKLARRKPSVASSASDKQRTKYVWLNVLPDDLWLKVRRGETVYEALHDTEVDLNGDCGGIGKCGKCKIKVLSSIGPPTEEEVQFLDDEELERGIRLACRTKVDKDLVINTAENGFQGEYFQILKTGVQPILHPDPLVQKRLITLPPYLQHESISELDKIKLVLVPEYRDLKASIHSLRTLPEKLRQTQYRGAAVLHGDLLMDWQNWEEVDRYYGLVFDLGTSTVVGKLINLSNGSEEAVVSGLNSQIKYGTNLISRLQYIMEREDGLDTMHRLIANDLNKITSRLLRAAGLKPDDIFIAVAAGNTTMQHLLLGLDPSGIAEAPFSPVLTDGLIVKASDVDLQLHPEGLLYVMPTKAGYIGGDLISVILASGVWEQDDEVILGLDLGTNGEVFLGNRRRLMTCSAAAGPALEGARISHGMIARAGAIEAVSFEDNSLLYHVIGNIRPKGICGSGLVEMIAVLLQLGVIDYEGTLRPSEGTEGAWLKPRLIPNDQVYDFMVASPDESYDQRPVLLTQKDIRELQLAKGAIAAGIMTLIDEMGITPHDIRRVYLAGALGNYVNPYSAVRIGLIPGGIDPEIITSIGNAASTGASMVLLAKEYWRTANELSGFIEHIELSSRVDFNQYFVENIDFPRENLQKSQDKVYWAKQLAAYQ